jgi:hypothetical protein
MKAIGKQTAIYQGLFLIALGLYAQERNSAHPVLIQKETIPSLAAADIPSSPELDAIYKKIKISPVFARPIDGLTLSKSARTIRIDLQSDEIYKSGEIAVEETWLPVLDQIGSAIFTGMELKADVMFVGTAQEEKDAFMTSGARGEWLLHYFNRKYQLRLDQTKYRVLASGFTQIPRLSIILSPENEF